MPKVKIFNAPQSSPQSLGGAGAFDVNDDRQFNPKLAYTKTPTPKRAKLLEILTVRDYEEVCRLEFLINRVNNTKQLGHVRGSPAFEDFVKLKSERHEILKFYGIT